MKNSIIIWSLVILLGGQTAVFARSFDKQKLLALDPRCTQRVVHQSAAFQNDRFWGNLGLGLALLEVVWNNSGGLGADAKLGNLIQGFTLLSTGAIIYNGSGDPLVQNDTLQLLDLKGIEAEEVAYSILKYNAARSRETRINSSLILMVTGLGYTFLTSFATSASQPYKEIMYLSAAFYFVQGIWNYRNPGQDEKDMEKIDEMVGASL